MCVRVRVGAKGEKDDDLRTGGFYTTQLHALNEGDEVGLCLMEEAS